MHKIIDLMLGRADFHHRINKPRRANDLLGKHAVRLLQLPIIGRGRDKDRLRTEIIPLIKFQRAVIHRGGQAEPILHQRAFTRVIALIHRADLRHHDMAFIQKHNRIFGEIFD